jgi:hypothetical protein
MRRFAIFAAVLIVIVAIGSRPGHRSSAYASEKDSICVCLPSRAKLMLKSMLNKPTATTVQTASIQRVTDKATTAQ